MVTDSKDKDLDPKSEVVGVLADGERFWQAFTPKTVPSAAQPCKKNRRPIGVILHSQISDRNSLDTLIAAQVKTHH